VIGWFFGSAWVDENFFAVLNIEQFIVEGDVMMMTSQEQRIGYHWLSCVTTHTLELIRDGTESKSNL